MVLLCIQDDVPAFLKGNVSTLCCCVLVSSIAPSLQGSPGELVRSCDEETEEERELSVVNSTIR